MDGFAAVALVWLTSVVIATIVGSLRGRSGDAMTLGVLLGPLGLLLALMVFAHTQRQDESPIVLTIGDQQPRQQAESESGTPLRRAA
jgi:hypothetical protein